MLKIGYAGVAYLVYYRLFILFRLFTVWIIKYITFCYRKENIMHGFSILRTGS